MNTPSMILLVEDYLAKRRQMGFALKIQGYQLKRFARFADDIGHRGPITLELAVRWAKSNATNSKTSAARISALRPFTKYLAQFEPATEIPPNHLFGRIRRRQVPHVYTAQEIQSLMDAAMQLPPACGLRPSTYETLIGLLASTGLRISEALCLTTKDVNLQESLITVRQTKFNKTRLVPLHPTTTQALRQYNHLRNEKVPAPSFDSFFMSQNGRCLRQDTVQHQFRTLCNLLDLRSRGEYPAPRIQDLRHTFITHCLLRWYREGIPIDKYILSLSTYVGHVEVSYTYWYLTGIPELMRLATRRFEQHFGRSL